ncbi:unnamed protein product [Sphagnum balticum]
MNEGDGRRSTANYVPILLLSFRTDARPACFPISEEVACALNICDNIGTLSFKGFRTGNDSPLNIDCALNFQSNRAGLVSVAEVIDLGGSFRSEGVDGDGGDQRGQQERSNFLHCRIFNIIPYCLVIL